MAPLFERVAVIGVGLIGGSFALAARAAGLVGHVTGVGRGAANLALARERGIVDRTTHEITEIGAVDLVLLAVPVPSVVPLARQIAPLLPAGSILTDVASVKASIVEALEASLPADRFFVGAHPIAGTERSGAAAAEPELFRGSRCVLTPTSRTDRGALERVEALWRGIGAEVRQMSPASHDQALAWTSHLVHTISYTLAGALGGRDPSLLELAGPSLRDATRVAASAPELWRDILLANADPVSDVMREFAAALESLREAIVARDEGALLERLRAGQRMRRELEAKLR